MIEKSIIKALKKRHGTYNFNGLIEYMQNTGYVYENLKLKGPLAIATLNGVLLDVYKLERFSDSLVFFIILHETAHMKRIDRMGKETMIKNLSIQDFKEFCNYLFVEEILADRYACRLFYHINKEVYNWCDTQELNIESKQKQYEPIARLYYGKIKNDCEKYNEVINDFIIN